MSPIYFEKEYNNMDTNMSAYTLCEAIEDGFSEIVRRLLLQGIDFKYDHCNPLIYAVQLRQHDIVRLLLIAGSDPNAMADAPLTSAAKNNDVQMMKILITAGANPLVLFEVFPSREDIKDSDVALFMDNLCPYLLNIHPNLRSVFPAWC